MAWDCGALLAAFTPDAAQVWPRLAGCYLGGVAVNWLHCEQLVRRCVSVATYLSPAVSALLCNNPTEDDAHLEFHV